MTVPSNDESGAIVMTVWSQEDKDDARIREKYIMREFGQLVDPYDSKFDDRFVFHALSKL
jgi:hypothetical protein